MLKIPCVNKRLLCSSGVTIPPVTSRTITLSFDIWGEKNKEEENDHILFLTLKSTVS